MWRLNILSKVVLKQDSYLGSWLPGVLLGLPTYTGVIGIGGRSAKQVSKIARLRASQFNSVVTTPLFSFLCIGV